MITPQTEIILLKSPLTLSNKHQMTFATKQAQYTYFTSLPKLIEDECQYQRKDNVIRFPAHADSLQTYNYLMFKNDNYLDKWFYAYITDIKYVNDNCSYISFKLDVYQTWQFDLVWKKSFIEREHVIDDTIGLHTIPENLDVGDIIEEASEVDDKYDITKFWIALSTSWLPTDNSRPPNGSQYSGVTFYNNQFFGNIIILFEITDVSTQGVENLGKFIARTNFDGHIEDIKDMWILPNACIDATKLTLHTTYAGNTGDTTLSYYTIAQDKTIEEFDTEINKLTSFTQYNPVNNKCFVYPYNYLFVDNNNGSQNIYKYEDFSTEKCVFKNQLAISIGCSGRLVPLNYRNKTMADDESLPLGKFPTCEWSADSYINWLTQNAINIPTKMITSLIPTVTTVKGKGEDKNKEFNKLKFPYVQMSESIASIIGDFYSASLAPNIEQGGNNGNIIFGANKMCFTFRKMRAKTEYLQTIDEFFSLYGYKVNTLKLPNLTNRPNWNYVKTIGANILGNIPQMDLAEIKEMFDDGVTLWHNPSTFLDYSQTNQEVT